MRPTALGWKALAFHALLTIAFYVSPYTNLFFLLLAFFATLISASALWTWSNVRGIRGQIEVQRPVPAAQSGGRVDLSLEAPRRSRRQLEVELRLDGAGTAVLAAVETLEAGATRQLGGSLPALPRGRHRLQGARVRSEAPLGLWSAATRISAPDWLLVHAAPIAPVHARHAGRGSAAGMAALAGRDAAAGPSGLRAWRLGDPLRAVDWRATARRRAPVVREYDGDRDRCLVVALDRRCAPEALERALSELVTLALRARERGERLELRTQGLTQTFGDAAQPIDALLAWTATANVVASDLAPPPAPSGAQHLPETQSLAGIAR